MWHFLQHILVGKIINIFRVHLVTVVCTIIYCSPAVRPTSATQNTQPKRTKKPTPLPPTPPMLNPTTVASTIGNITDTKGVPSHARSQPIAVMSLSNILKKVSGNVSSVDHDQKKKSVSTQDSDTETDENSDNYVSEQSDSGSGSTTN